MKHKLKFNWKLAIGRTIVNGAAIAFAALILPGIEVPGGNVVTYLILGAVFGLLNAFVKPIVQFLTLPLIFVTYGLVIIVINTVMLLIMAWLFWNILIVRDWWAAVLGGTLIAFLGLILENFLGLTPPIVDERAVAKEGQQA